MSTPDTPSTAKALAALLLLVPVPGIGVLLATVWEPTRGTGLGQFAYAAGKLWILVLPLLWAAFVERESLKPSAMTVGGLRFGASLGLFIAAVILAAYWLVGRGLIDTNVMRAAAARNGISSPAVFLAFAAYLALINSLLEEYVWRWFVFRRCESLVGGRSAVFLSSLLFTVHHVIALKAQTNWTVTLLGSLGVFAGGLAWSWCYLRFRSIWPGYVSHVIADLAVLTVGWIVLFGAL